VRANRLNHTVVDSPRAWFGIVTGGKAYLDTMQALEDLGLDRPTCEQLGIRVFKCGVVWPLEAATVREFATGLDEILVVEEKRQIIEYALKEELYNWRDDVRPRIYGKFDEKDGSGGEWAMPQGQWLLPALYELSPAIIAKAIAARLLNPGQYASRLGGQLPAEIRARIESRLAIIEAKERALAEPHLTVNRTPTFCSGCPHNTSTHVPEGSRAVAGIGCHYMVTWMPERRTETFTQMGGEGVPWIGQAPFTDEKHIFANLGDGTYFHSGYLAVRASIAAGVNITYKILYNDAVAMTGGQPVDGTLTVPQIVAQMTAEGARKVVIVTDEPDKYDDLKTTPTMAGVEVHHRDHLDWVQRQLREVPGCTVLIYDQTCASEKRRRRKKVVDGKPGFPDPPKRVVINEGVCEGCGDCSVQSSCVSVEPVETEFGRKRRINQSSCNKDYSCLKGFCPSFVTVEGGALRKGRAPGAAVVAAPGEAAGNAAGNAAGERAAEAASVAAGLPEPQRVSLGDSGDAIYGILVTGVGGTGVVTIGQLIGMASHLEGKGISVLDMAGLAQKGGAVFSHVQIAPRPEDLFATRIATGEADLLIGCDLVVSAGNEALSKMRTSVTRAVINGNVSPTSDFLRDPDWSLPADALKRNVLDAAGEQDIDFVDASDLATALLGDGLYTNPLLLGYAWQKGWIPLTREALERAIELNGVSVDTNLLAFAWGRRVAHDPHSAARLAAPTPQAQVIQFRRPVGQVRSAADLDELIARRVAFLTGYHSAAWAERYRTVVQRVRRAESDRIGVTGRARLTEAVARYLCKLMSYKDEYEVARLHSDPAFLARIGEQFEGDWKLRFHLAPPLLTKVDPLTGKPVKRTYGPRMMTGFRLLARLKFLRGTPLDPFGRTDERRTERALITEYEALVDELLARLDPANHELAVELARIPETIRGYGHVKERQLQEARARWAELLVSYRGGAVPGAQPIVLRAGGHAPS
jgi:indolepyruvate ferredoxin oxidoreductase